MSVCVAQLVACLAVDVSSGEAGGAPGTARSPLSLSLLVFLNSLYS